MDLTPYIPPNLITDDIFVEIQELFEKAIELGGEAEFVHILQKYKNPLLLDEDTLLASIEEMGYNYVSDIFVLSTDQLRILVSYLVLIHFMKGTKGGLELVFKLLSIVSYTIEEWWEEIPDTNLMGNPIDPWFFSNASRTTITAERPDSIIYSMIETYDLTYPNPVNGKYDGIKLTDKVTTQTAGIFELFVGVLGNTLNSSSQYVFSFYVAKVTSTPSHYPGARISMFGATTVDTIVEIDNENGTIKHYSSFNGYDSINIASVDDNWWRVQIVQTTPASHTSCNFQIFPASNDYISHSNVITGENIFYGFQVELGGIVTTLDLARTPNIYNLEAFIDAIEYGYDYASQVSTNLLKFLGQYIYPKAVSLIVYPVNETESIAPVLVPYLDMGVDYESRRVNNGYVQDIHYWYNRNEREGLDLPRWYLWHSGNFLSVNVETSIVYNNYPRSAHHPSTLDLGLKTSLFGVIGPSNKHRFGYIRKSIITSVATGFSPILKTYEIGTLNLVNTINLETITSSEDWIFKTWTIGKSGSGADVTVSSNAFYSEISFEWRGYPTDNGDLYIANVVYGSVA